jgi:hypothetical protein
MRYGGIDLPEDFFWGCSGLQEVDIQMAGTDDDFLSTGVDVMITIFDDFRSFSAKKSAFF